MDIVLVEWTDAQEETRALLPEQAEQQQGIPTKTVGFLKKQTKSEVTISATCFDYNQTGEHYRSNWTIPMGCVKKIRKLGKV